MRRILSAILVFSLMFLVGCSSKEDKVETPKKDKLSIVCTVFPSYDFARQIIGELGEVELLLPVGAESHSFNPTLSDIALVEGCDVFIYVGGEIDPWASEIVENSSNKERINLSLLEALEIEEKHNHDEHGDEVDEHVWTSISNSITICKKISEALCKKDKENEAKISLTTSEYIEKLKELKSSFETVVKNASNDTLIFADRFPFYWFTKEFSLNYVAALSGCSSDTEPTLTALKNVIDAVKNTGTNMVLYIEGSSGSIADKVVDETGAKKRVFHSCHNVSTDEKENGETYISLMQKNLEVLKEALG